MHSVSEHHNHGAIIAEIGCSETIILHFLNYPGVMKQEGKVVD